MPAVALGTAAAAAVSASSKAVATERNPSTVAASLPVVAAAVVTDVAGAVSAAAEQARIDAGRRIRSALLPESVFVPSSCRGSRGRQQQQQRTTVATTTTITARRNNNNNSTAGGGVRSSDGFPQKTAPFVSAPTAAAAAAIAGEDIHVGVREALDRWALQT